jgi:hypothetical protein
MRSYTPAGIEIRHPSRSKMAIALMKKLADRRLNLQLYT